MDLLLAVLGHWLWWVLVGVLLILELMAPGVFFIWLAIAAAGVALIDGLVDLSWQYELLLFAILSLVSVFAGRALLKRRQDHDSDSPHLNKRMQGYVGRRITLDEPISDGRGRVTIEGTVWEVLGADAPKGTHVRVTGTDGLRLTVEPA
ncbi:MAG: NfeD family protein [Alphaproteobacteria bacterium]|nr:NfeD family protein [Alphaproteobacteria bacterium]